MDYVLRFRLFPTSPQRERLDWVRDTVRQVYNHALHRFNRIPESAGTVRQRVLQVRDELPDLKDWWDDLTDVYSTVLQQAVEQIETNVTNLSKLKEAGYNVGSLNWKAPHEYRSFTYRQRGFELDEKSGPDGRGLLTLKKINGETVDVPIRLHRRLPAGTDVKHVTIKKDKTGAWYACLNVERGTPENRPQRALMPKIVSESTLESRSSFTILIGDKSIGLICPLTGSGWNVNNRPSLEKNTGRATGNNSGRRLLKSTSGCGTKKRISSTR